MRYSIYFICLFVFLSFSSCKEKDCAEAAVNHPGFIDSLNQELRRNIYFGIDSVKWVKWSIDTVRLFRSDRNVGIKYANIHYKIHYEGVRTSLTINYFPNPKREEIEYVKDLYLMEKQLENLSVYIEMGNFFCTIILDDTLGENTFPYLQNVKIAVLQEYIRFLTIKRASG
jgi:hypothetical protein